MLLLLIFREEGGEADRLIERQREIKQIDKDRER